MPVLSLPVERFHLLAHPQRLAILRCLMAGPATLSQLGAHFHESPAHIRHHLKILQEAGLVAQTTEPEPQNRLEKYYQATTEALLINQAVLPETPPGRVPLLVSSKDVATRSLALEINRHVPGLAVQIIPLNSIDGLLSLRQGTCQMATCHLPDVESGAYNLPYVRRFFPGQEMALLSLYLRDEGLIVPAGNPLGIHSLVDLARPGLRFINREPGAGIRVWFDHQLKVLGMGAHKINGYARLAGSHQQVAQAVREGQADAGLGIAAAARQNGLDFVPLLEEPYDLVFSAGLLSEPCYQDFFDHLQSGNFRASICRLDGYQVAARTGQADIIAN
jgi:putative molybdopterin biosynthesis protein